MPKIMLVEDDNNLREIYGERLMAEGYEIISAGDGEEALAMAVKEKPDLIISDVMMPKISGFDMLDILRQTPETKFTKVIMMTALSQTEDKDRADRLGADKYLVKSQVTLEDVARVVHDLIYGPDEAAAAPAADASSPAAEATEPAAPAVVPIVAATTVAAEPVATPVSVTPIPVATEAPAAEPAATTPVVAPVEPVVSAPAPEPTTEPATPVANPITGTAANPIVSTASVASATPQSSADEEAAIAKQIDNFVADNSPAVSSHESPMVEPSQQDLIHAQNAVEEPTVVKAVLPEKDMTVPPVTPEEPSESLEPASARKKVIEPLNDPTMQQPNINELYEQEMAKEAANSPVVNPQSVAAPAELPDNPISNPAVAPAPELQTADATAIEGLSFDQQPVIPDPAAPAVQPQVQAPEKEDKAPDPNDPASFAL